MTAMLKDINSRLNTPRHRQPIDGINFSEILYADDTLLFHSHTQSLNKLLKEVQVESAYYNLKLNFGKCINLTLHQKQSSVKFMNGELVPRKKRAIYLGSVLDAENRNKVFF